MTNEFKDKQLTGLSYRVEDAVIELVLYTKRLPDVTAEELFLLIVEGALTGLYAKFLQDNEGHPPANVDALYDAMIANVLAVVGDTLHTTIVHTTGEVKH